MTEAIQGAQSRVAARGNVFSFQMPFEEILQNLRRAADPATRVPLPHDGSVLATLLRVHIIGGSVDITQHIRDVHIRAEVVLGRKMCIWNALHLRMKLITYQE